MRLGGCVLAAGRGVTSTHTMHLKLSGSGRSGRWRTERCSGRLVYLLRTDGYTRLREVLSTGPCTGGVVDWVKRQGAGLVDSFRSKSGATYNSRGTLQRG